MTKLPSQFKYQKQVVVLTSSICVMAFAYIFLVGVTVSNAFEKQQAENEIRTITAKLSETEFSYLEKRATINASLARGMGFVEPEKVLIARVDASSNQTAFLKQR